MIKIGWPGCWSSKDAFPVPPIHVWPMWYWLLFICRTVPYCVSNGNPFSLEQFHYQKESRLMMDNLRFSVYLIILKFQDISCKIHFDFSFMVFPLAL